MALSACTKQAEAPKVATPKTEAPKPVTVDVVRETERSKSFLAVSRQLELGGPLYAYMDVDGDVLKLAGGLKSLLEQIAKVQPMAAPYVKQDFAALATTLGLTDVKAVGFSSVPQGDGVFRNRSFLYTGGERHGLMAGLGGKPGPLKHVGLAPADAAFFSEGEMDLPVIYKTIKEVVTKVAGEPVGNEMEAGIKKGGEAIALSLLDLIYGLKGRSATVLRLDATKPLRIPAPPAVLTLPAISLLICVEGIAPVVEVALGKSPVFKRTDDGALHIYELKEKLPIEGLQPVLVADGSTLYFATTRAFYDECRTQKTGLAQTAEFQRALTQVGAEGNGLGYVSPKFFEQLRQTAKLNPNLPPEAKSVVDLVVAQLPETTLPLVTMRTNLPDGVLIRSYWNRSLKQDVALISVYNPITVGLLASMAIPAFQKVRMASQEKAVLNNLRMLAAASDQFYLETGTTAATFADIVGPTRYVKAVQSVAGENYRQVRFAQGEPLRVVLPDGRAIQYPPPQMQPAPTLRMQRPPAPKQAPTKK